MVMVSVVVVMAVVGMMVVVLVMAMMVVAVMMVVVAMVMVVVVFVGAVMMVMVGAVMPSPEQVRESPKLPFVTRVNFVASRCQHKKDFIIHFVTESCTLCTVQNRLFIFRQ